MRFVFLVVLLFVASSVYGQNFNRPTPSTLPPYEFVKTDPSYQGKHFLLAPFYFNGSSQASKSMQVIDEDGYIAWFTAGDKKVFDFKYNPTVNRYSFSKRSNGIVKHYEMNTNFELVDSLSIPVEFNSDSHEFQFFPNGNRCVLGNGHTTMDLTGYTFGGVPAGSNVNVIYTVILEYDPTGNIVFQWESIDHLSVDHFSSNFNFNANHFDYLHANSIELDTDGNLIVSMRTSDMVVKIDRTNGDILWKLGGNFSDFTFTNDAGFFGQHDARRLPNGNVSIFDNDFPSNHARGVEYQLDTNNWTATRISETNYPFNFPAKSMGGYRILDNAYSIVGWGNTRRPAPSVTLFDPSGNIATDFFFKDTVITYRAFYQELPPLPDRPIIDCEETQTGITLSVPDTSQYYLWSTSESTASVDISGTGIFQCWINQGIGMTGSFPIEITSAGECPTVDLSTINLSKKTIVSYYDLSGRKINSPTKGVPYIIEYSDGSTERKLSLKL